MAGCPVARLMLSEHRSYLAALFSGIWTSGVETASAWRIHRTWHVSFQNNTLSCPAQLWIRNRNCGKQGLCIWMDRMSVQLIALAQLNKRAKIHNTDSVGNMTDNGKIMGNEQISQTKAAAGLRPPCRHRGKRGAAGMFTTCDWIETSNAEIGSSQTMNSGFTARARAIPTRCC